MPRAVGQGAERSAQSLVAARRPRPRPLAPRTLRTLGRAWCRVVWRCWQDGVAYDPARHRGLQQHITVTIPGSSSPRLDLTATKRMADAAVTDTAAQRDEREALDGKPPTATTPQG